MRKIYFLILFCSLVVVTQSNIVLKEEMELHNIKLHEALSIISKELGVSIVSDNASKDNIQDLFFSKGESLDSILEIIASSNELSLSIVDNIYFLSAEANKTNEINKIEDFSYDYNKMDKSNLGEITLTGNVVASGYNIGVNDVKVSVKNSGISPEFTSDDGQFSIKGLSPGVCIVNFSKNGYISKGEIINLDSKEKHINVEFQRDNEVLQKDLDNDNLVFSKPMFIDNKVFYTQIFDIKGSNISEITTILTEIFGDSAKISKVPKTNKLVVSAEKDIIYGINNILKEIDTYEKQAKITAQILDISDNLFEELGFDWIYNNPSTKKNSTLVSLINTAFPLGIGIVSSSKLSLLKEFGSKSDILSLGINLLQSNQDLVVSSSPYIFIANGEEGEFKITEEIIVGEKKTKTEKDSYISEPIFKEAGTILKVIPLIKNDNSVTLKIIIEVSDFKFRENPSDAGNDFSSKGGSKIGRSLSTIVNLKNGETILIGGLRRYMSHFNNSQVPYVGDIPVLGNLFKKESSRQESTDMYIKLKVEVMEEGDRSENMLRDKNYREVDSEIKTKIF